MRKLVRMRPYARPMVWAGTRLTNELGPCPSGQRIGEALDVSGLAAMSSVVAGGEDDGLPLSELFVRERGSLLGPDAPATERFPLLLKRLDAGEMLSVQVHPDDETARRLEGEPNGKCEAWVVLDADPGAAVHLGFRDDVTLEMVESKLRRGERLLPLLRRLEVEPGDVVPVHPGCVHAIGPGLYLYEIQQPSDLTYRLDDFGRRDAQGSLRELHVEKGLGALRIDLRPGVAVPESERPAPGIVRERLCDMGPFRLDRWRIDGRFAEEAAELRIVQGVRGETRLTAGGDEESVSPGDTVVVPATTGRLCAEAVGGEILVASLAPA